MLLRDRFEKPDAERDAWAAFQQKVDADPAVDGLLKARVHNRMAISYFYTNEYDKGWAEVEQAEALIATLPAGSASGFLYELLAYASLISTDLKEIDRASAYAERSMTEALRSFGEESGAAALAYNAKGYLGYKTGNTKLAQQHMCSAAVLAARHLPLSDPMVANNYVSCGVTMYFNDDPKTAETMEYAASIAYENLAPQHPVVGLALNGSSGVLNLLGRYAETEIILQRQIEIERRNRGLQSPEVYNPLSMLADVLVAQGKLEEALAIQRNATAYAHQMDKGGDPSARGFSSVKLAVLLDQLGPNDESRQLYLSGIEEVKADLQPGDAWIHLAELAYAHHLYRSDDQAGGLTMAQRAFADLTTALPEGHRDRIVWDLRIAEMMAQQGQAEAGYARGLPIANRLEEKLLGYASARPELISYSPIMTAGFASFAHSALLAGDEEAAVKAAQLTLLSELSTANANLALRAAAKDKGFDDRLQAIRRTRSELQTLKASLMKAEAEVSDNLQEISQKSRERQSALETLEKSLAEDFPEYTGLSRPSVLSLAEIRANLSDDQAVIFPVALSDQFLTIIVTRTGLYWDTSDNHGMRLYRQTSQLLSEITNARFAGDIEQTGFNANAAHQLFRTIFPGSLYGQIADKSELLFPASGAIAKLPPHIMLTRPARAGEPLSQLPWLVREKSVAIYSSLGEQMKPLGEKRVRDRFAGIGAPTLNGGGPVELASVNLFRGGAVDVKSLRSLPELPKARSELQQIETAFGSNVSTLLTGNEATEKAVRALDLTSYSVIAFATHGLVSGELNGLLEPALVFTPPDQTTPENDGLLTATEISQMTIPADWVILSACNSGGGRNNSAPTYSGLARAFRLAGARSLLLSHWEVRDDAAAMLTINTVKNAAAGMPRSEALRQAQLKLIDDPSIPGAAHPAIWAPFILIGS
ncbi:CHAT domain-containing tetratricopeptide repeat protein [Parasphingorhabdus sp.]|uniref:CHAT domain-containing tetratricopeptide repeat protein n=1 Tax=Parasphingorhabdus sp. TaxID=2709688 RepID=UPI0030036276